MFFTLRLIKPFAHCIKLSLNNNKINTTRGILLDWFWISEILLFAAMHLDNRFENYRCLLSIMWLKENSGRTANRLIDWQILIQFTETHKLWNIIFYCAKVLMEMVSRFWTLLKERCKQTIGLKAIVRFDLNIFTISSPKVAVK